MNNMTFAIAATLPVLLLLMLNFESIHGYYAYTVPVARSTVDIYTIVYVTVEEDGRGYSLSPFQSLNRTFVTEYVGSDSHFLPFLIADIVLLDNEVIRVDFGDKGYTIFSHDGTSYRPAPPFSHTETIKVNQTFLALCTNHVHERSNVHDSTGLAIYQYRGTETYKITKVKQMLPVTEYGKDGATGLLSHGDTTYATRDTTLSPPKEVLVYKFLAMAAYTDSRIRCDYPQIIEHTVDSKRIDPADFKTILQGWAELKYGDSKRIVPDNIKASTDVLYEWYN